MNLTKSVNTLMYQNYGMRKCLTCWDMCMNRVADFAVIYRSGEMEDMCSAHYGWVKNAAGPDGIWGDYLHDNDPTCPRGYNEAACDAFCDSH